MIAHSSLRSHCSANFAEINFSLKSITYILIFMMEDVIEVPFGSFDF